MADLDKLRADFANIAPDDAVCIFVVPREGENRPHRHLRFYQVQKIDIWDGVGEGEPMPSYVVPPDDPEPVEPPKPPPVETVQMVVICDWLNLRSAAGLKGAKVRQVKRGTVLTVVKAAGALDGFVWHKLQGEDLYVAEKSENGKDVFLAPKA